MPARIPGLKYASPCFEIIKIMRTPRWGKICGGPFTEKGIKAFIQPEGKGFQIQFRPDWTVQSMLDMEPGDRFYNLTFVSGKRQIRINNVYLQSRSGKYKAKIDQFSSIDYKSSKLHYYRLIIPLTKPLDFFNEIEQAVFETDTGLHSREGTIALFGSESISAYILKQNDKSQRRESFLIIESNRKVTASRFSKKAHAVEIALGYLTGHYVGNQGYTFAYRHKQMKDFTCFHFTEFRNPIKSGYRPLTDNPYSWLYKKDRLAKKYENKLRTLSVKEFSLLCNRIYDSTLFSSTLLLILESSAASLRFMPGGFAIALESLSKIIVDKKHEHLSPITDPKIIYAIKKDCKNIIISNTAGVNEERINVLVTRINELNKPTNKSLLKAPFDTLGIKLTKEDEMVLKSRNDLLHGRIPIIFEKTKNRSDKRSSLDLYHTGLHFYTLINMLILKWVGYDGYVINHPMIQKSATKIKLKQEYYRPILT